ncbi:MAG: methylenetetrahydrofolate reductase C-terminal domain-containing protein, partial [Phycisphaerae bacterium]
ASVLAAFKNAQIQSILAMTGDKPIKAKGVFELEAVGLLQLINRMNNESLLGEKKPKDAFRYFPGAVVSPFKYTESSQMQQYYKMEKKIKASAEFIITQIGWDWRKSQELFSYLQDNRINVPVLGYVYLLTNNIVLKRMHGVDITGCYVSDELFEKVQSETFEQHIERAAQQVAMYKQLGAAGVDIGGVYNFEVFAKILTKAARIAEDWEKYKENLYWPMKNGWYLYDENGKKAALSKPKKKFKQRFFNLFHRVLFDRKYRGFRCFKKTMSFLGTEKGRGFFYRFFFSFEVIFKYLLFNCEQCGDCYLPEDFGVCTIGDCEKKMVNSPCGDSTADGRCGNNLDIICVAEKIYNAAAAEENGLNKLRNTIEKPRKAQLEHTASILNYLFGKDHTMKSSFISIGESIHASIPKTGAIMKELLDGGPNSYTKDSEALNYVKALIQSQADEGADYIAVNVDAFGETNPQAAIDTMTEYVKLVRKYADGVPVCIDSSNDDVLKAGLKEWYNTEQDVAQPLINSIKVYTMDNMFPLKKDYDYAFVGLLMSEDAPTGPGGSHSVDELYSLAKKIFEEAVGKYGFKPTEIFFDSTVFPLAIDMPMQPDVPGYTYRTFETIKKIKSDPKMKDVHFTMGVSNCARDLPCRKIGIMRAYVHTAMKYGCDAGIVNVKHHLYEGQPDPDLLKLVEAYALMDGSMDKCTDAMMLMGKFCQEAKK